MKRFLRILYYAVITNLIIIVALQVRILSEDWWKLLFLFLTGFLFGTVEEKYSG